MAGLINKSSRIKIFPVLILFLAFLMLSSCKDSEVVTPQAGGPSFTYRNLKHLNPNVDGVYEAWISFPPHNADHGDNLYVSCGKFNINASTGELEDTSGNPITLKLKYIPETLNHAEDAIVTIEPPFDTDTLPSLRLMGGVITVGSDFLSASLDMKFEEALGVIAENFSAASAKYILDTPTDTTTQFFYNGIWFCDTLGNSLFTNLLAIPDTIDWIYQGWILDTRTMTYYSLGRFSNPDSIDSDAGGEYANPPFAAGYNKPGQDYVRNSPPIENFTANYFTLFITLEPKNEPASSPPFFIQLFKRDILQSILTRGMVSDNIPNLSANLPSATIKVSK